MSETNSSQSIALLAQKFEEVERRSYAQAKKIEELQQSAARSEGAREANKDTGDWVKKLAPLVIGVAGALAGSLLYSGIEDLEDLYIPLATYDEANTQRNVRINARLNKLEAKKPTSLNNVYTVLENLNTRLVHLNGQLVAVVEVDNQRHAYMNQTMQVLWNRTGDGDLPDMEFYPTNIPSQTVNTLDKINQ